MRGLPLFSAFQFLGTKDARGRTRQELRRGGCLLILKRNLQVVFHAVQEEVLPLSYPCHPPRLTFLSLRSPFNGPEAPGHHAPSQDFQNSFEALNSFFSTKT